MCAPACFLTPAPGTSYFLLNLWLHLVCTPYVPSSRPGAAPCYTAPVRCFFTTSPTTAFETSPTTSPTTALINSTTTSPATTPSTSPTTTLTNSPTTLPVTALPPSPSFVLPSPPPLPSAWRLKDTQQMRVLSELPPFFRPFFALQSLRRRIRTSVTCFFKIFFGAEL